MNKLIPLSEYVLLNEIRMSNPELFKSKVYAYANLLRQPLTLSMFVPVDDEGIELKHRPRFNDYSSLVAYRGDVLEYDNACEKVLFEGFNITREDTGTFYLVFGQYLTFAEKEYKCDWEFVKRFQHVESLLKAGVEITLTRSALKIIGKE